MDTEQTQSQVEPQMEVSTEPQVEPQMNFQERPQGEPQGGYAEQAQMYQHNTQSQQQPQQQGTGNGIACMVLGIVSIVFGCTPLIGLVCGIIAIIMNRKDAQMGIQSGYHKAGNVCGIIGVCLGGLALIYWIVVFCAAACVATVSVPYSGL